MFTFFNMFFINFGAALIKSTASKASPKGLPTKTLNIQAAIKSAARPASPKDQIQGTKLQGSARTTGELDNGNGRTADQIRRRGKVLPWGLVPWISSLGRLR